MTTPPANCYEMLAEQLSHHGEDVSALQTRSILLDGVASGGEQRLLLQNFFKNLVGPVFFEFIQRKVNDGFDEDHVPSTNVPEWV